MSGTASRARTSQPLENIVAMLDDALAAIDHTIGKNRGPMAFSTPTTCWSSQKARRTSATCTRCSRDRSQH